MAFVAAFTDPRSADPQLVGMKFFHLARASARGFPVPAARAITTAAHRHYLVAGTWPDGLRAEVLAAAHRLDLGRGLSVRSSAVREDLGDLSFAGQYRTFLRVATEAELLARVEACWESASSETVRSYLRAAATPGAEAQTPLLAVILQQMVPARIAGVAFSKNPLRPAADEMVIEAVHGPGEGLVSGRRTPCRARLNGRGRIEIESRPRSRAGARLEAETPWFEIAALLRRLEADHDGAALDIEWAVGPRRDLWLLQVRPITALAADDELPPPGIWTRKIADDLWADRLEPFMAAVMLAHAPAFDLSAISRKVGLVPVRPALAVIDGYLYVNVEGIRQVIARIPRGLRLRHLETLLPAAAPIGEIAGPRPAELARLVLGVLRLPLSEPGAVPFLCLRRAPAAIARLRERLPGPARPREGAGAAELFSRLKENLETLRRLQENNQWPYFHANASAALLAGVATERLGMSGGEFLALIGGGGDNVTLRIERWFRDTAARIRRDGKLAERFGSDPPAEPADRLPEWLDAELERFLACFGCRARHRSLLVPRWAESPEEVLAILKSLVRHPQASGAAAGPQAAAATAGAAGRVRFRPLLRLLARTARRFLDLREELRFLMDEVLYRIRLDLLALGGRLQLGALVFFLKPEEIEALVEGKASREEAERTAARRQARFQKPVAPSTFWVDGRPEFDFPEQGTVLAGIGTSAGRASGRAVIVTDPASARIRPGDVVVARHTDPGWTPILSVIGAIVMEEGGLLNHCSIVARELGIPSVVGVRRATRLIPEGARVTVDGGAGMVRIEPD
jgi:pyruvate,water dikinase